MSLQNGDGTESLTVLYIATSIDPYNSWDHYISMRRNDGFCCIRSA